MIPGSKRFPGEGNSNPLQYSCLENSMDDSAHVQNGLGIVQSTTQKGIGPDSELRMPYVLRYLLCVKFLTDIISLNTTTHQVAQMVKCLPAVQKTWV